MLFHLTSHINTSCKWRHCHSLQLETHVTILYHTSNHEGRFGSYFQQVVLGSHFEIGLHLLCGFKIFGVISGATVRSVAMLVLLKRWKWNKYDMGKEPSGMPFSLILITANSLV